MGDDKEVKRPMSSDGCGNDGEERKGDAPWRRGRGHAGAVEV